MSMRKYFTVIPVLFFMALAVLVSGCIGSDNVEVIGSDLEVTAHSMDTENWPTSVNLTVRNNGTSKISYVPVNVTFYDSNGNLDNSEGSVAVNMKPGDEKNFLINSSSGNTIGSYKIIVGDPKTNVTAEVLASALKPLVDSYSSSKGTDSSSITVIGTTINAGSYANSGNYGNDDSTTYSLEGNATIFMEMDSGRDYVGQWVYQTSGDVVSGYRPYVDVAVIYWPKMKVAGWHRLYGSTPNVETTGYGGDIEGSAPDMQEWIDSLPKK